MTGPLPPPVRPAWRTWRAAMADALYGDGGLYVDSGAPARHFRTAAHTSPLWADCWLRAAEAVAASLAGASAEPFAVVDMGAGGGELLAAMADLAPADWRLVGVDVAPRPVGLPDRVEWAARPPERIHGLCVAVEWLDVVPVDVVELAEDGPRLVEVDNSGEERLGGPVDDEQRGWLDRWWPLAEVGDRAEVGLPRDRAWRGLVDRMAAGVAVAVDYAAVPALHLAGTLTGYRDGRQVPPVPDGSCDITAHVLVESCAGGSAEVLTQREALHRLGLRGRVPAYSGDPRRHLDDLARASAAAELLDPAGLGGFAWLVEPVGGGRLWPQEPVGDSPT